jgi:hypothetical protein
VPWVLQLGQSASLHDRVAGAGSPWSAISFPATMCPGFAVSGTGMNPHAADEGPAGPPRDAGAQRPCLAVIPANPCPDRKAGRTLPPLIGGFTRPGGVVLNPFWFRFNPCGGGGLIAFISVSTRHGSPPHGKATAGRKAHRYWRCGVIAAKAFYGRTTAEPAGGRVTHSARFVLTPMFMSILSCLP